MNELIMPFGRRLRHMPFRALFEDFPGDSFEGPENFRRAISELNETENEVIAKLEMPGIEKENIEITVSDRGLEVKGTAKEEKENKGKGGYSYSSNCSGFYRLIALPESTNAEKAEASYKNGILEITIPKKAMPAPKARKIPVK